MRLAYLFSRYPIVSQTFCDTEILALEKLGFELELYSIYPPPTSFRHGHARRMRASLHYAPPSPVLKLGEAAAKAQGRWPVELIEAHEARYGPAYKASLRARNALYFADLFQQRGIAHFHVHFANRAAHTAIFLKAISGIPFSLSTHGQDFMVDLGCDALLQEMCHEAEFVANETNFSKELVSRCCTDSTAKMHRVFNGMDLGNFPPPPPTPPHPEVRILATGRLIEFKGFHHLIPACALLRQRGLGFRCDIIGEGPWRETLQAQIDDQQLGGWVHLLGALPQDEVFAALRACDIFTLPCTTDRLGATDVFPTVILEAMASAKPVVSTRLAGVPEQIVDGESGLLVAPGDEAGLAGALAALIEAPERRAALGQAARIRLEREFSVEQTVQPLRDLFLHHAHAPGPKPETRAGLGCLLERWPPTPAVARELEQLRAVQPSLRVYAAEGGPATLPTFALLPMFDFLPDGMVLEGEWQQERELARRIETWRAELGQQLPSDLFLREARRALYLRRWLAPARVRHLHALGGNELLMGWLLQRLTGLTWSVTLEDRPAYLHKSLLLRLLENCQGVRTTLPEIPLRTNWYRTKPGAPLEDEWKKQMATWAS